MKGFFSFAITFALCFVPTPVFARDNATTLEKYIAQADVVVKATALQSEPQADTKIDSWFTEIRGAGRYATRFKIVSVIKGDISAEEVIFRHYKGLSVGPPIRVYFFKLPPCYTFKVGQTYLLWANKTDDGNLRQLSKEMKTHPTDGGTTGYLIRVGDDEPVQGEIKDVVWDELVKMAHSNTEKDAYYGMQTLSWLSGATNFVRRGEFVNKNPDFALNRFADVFMPLLDSSDEKILYVGFNAFGGNAAQFAQSRLLLIANWHANLGARAMALGCLRSLKTQGEHAAALHALHDFPAAVNGRDANGVDKIAALQQSALQTLADFPSHDSRIYWRAFATHPKERVRRGVASAIGFAKDAAAADLLFKMVDDSELIVRETALNSLLQLPAMQAAPFWKKLQHHGRYGPLFTNALAAQNVEPYLSDLVKILNHDVQAESILNYRLNDVDNNSWQLLFKYIKQKPKATLESAALSDILEALEYSHLMPPTLYRFYRTKKMKKRAKSYLDRLGHSLLNIYDKEFKEIDRQFVKR